MNKTEVDYLKELVAFKTVTDDFKEAQNCAQYCANFFETRGFRTKIVEHNGYPNVIATTKDTKNPKIFLQAHMDVVPASEVFFKLKDSGSRLYGRGTFDMKFACASYFKVIENLSQSLDNYNFGVMLTFDEEVGGSSGVGAVLEDGYGCEVCVLPDSGKDWCIETSAKGAWFVKLVKKGKNAHASEPHAGINSAELLTSALSDLFKIRKTYDKSDLTVTLTKFSSGDAMNQVPDHAEATLDIRYRNNRILQNIKSQIDQLARKHGLENTTKMLGACTEVNRKEPVVCDFLDIAERVLGRKINESHSAGSTDGRYFCAKGIPCIIIQPDGGRRHSDQEWVDKQGMSDLTEIILQFIEKYAIIK